MSPRTPVSAIAEPIVPGGPWQLVVRRLAHRRAARIAIAAVAGLVVVAVLAPVLAPYDPAAQPDVVLLKSLPPSLGHPFGTDPYSRDVLSRVMFGARVSLSVACLAVILSATLGTAWGALAGFAGGAVDAVMMRLVDGALSVPRVLVLIAVLALWGRLGVASLTVLIGLTGWFGVSRLVRAEVRTVARQEWVAAAEALGATGMRRLMRHVIPHVVSPVIVAATLAVGNVIALEAGLSYFGIGVAPPQASWGNIMQEGSDRPAALWWLSVFPGLAVVATTLAFNVLGDALRDALDPRETAATHR